MAASFRSLLLPSSATQDLVMSSPISSRSNHFRSISSFRFPNQIKELRSVKAMGVAKFKGTHMREKHLTEMIEKKVMEAKKACEGDAISDECKVAWDEVEEISQAKADFRLKMEKQDPLESFCQENPETDECRIYED